MDNSNSKPGAFSQADDLKKRISSIKSTQKITKAMKMVAAAKLRKAQESAEKGRPYSEKMNNIILNLSNLVSDRENASKFLVGTEEDSVHLCVLLQPIEVFVEALIPLYAERLKIILKRF